VTDLKSRCATLAPDEWHHEGDSAKSRPRQVLSASWWSRAGTPGQHPVTTQGLSITNLFWLELLISGLLLAGVVGLLTVALVRFRVPVDDAADARQVPGRRAI
jgi:hypothetical protein